MTEAVCDGAVADEGTIGMKPEEITSMFTNVEGLAQLHRIFLQVK